MTGKGRGIIIIVALAMTLIASCATTSGTPSKDGQGDGGDTSLISDGDRGPDSDSDDELPEELPTSSELIAAAVEDGDIDDATALLYRTYLLFGDRTLPDEYMGEPEAHDLGLTSELQDALPDLPDDIRAQIEPYLLRPSDPDSAFSTGGLEPPGLRTVGGSMKASDAIRATDTASMNKCANWDTEPVAGTGFRVWVCDDADVGGPVTSEQAIRMLSDMIGNHAPKMVADMGPLIPDDPEKESDDRADDNIDIYVLPDGWMGPYRENYSASTDYGVTLHSPPYSGVTTSAYVMVATDLLSDPNLLERVVVHELFHVLQRTHNAHLGARWFTEASAEWAASYYVRHGSTRLHEVRVPVKQDRPDVSLHEFSGLYPYGAYLWPLFMEQEAGAEAIFAAWEELGDAPRNAGHDYIIQAISNQIDVEEAFPEFAMRLFNAADLDGDPVRPRFVDLDGHFPDGRLPWIIDRVLDDELTIPVRVMSELSSKYYRVQVPPEPGDNDDAGVLVRVSSDAVSRAGTAVTVEAVAQSISGKYRRQLVDVSGVGTDICVKDEAYLVVAHPGTGSGDFADGKVVLERQDDRPCARVEAVHPEFFFPLADDDPVEVDGVEGDGKPDNTAVAVTVTDAEADRISDYEVSVTVSGGTLTSSRTFTWPLSSFDDLGDGKWRKVEPLPLDIDLTDANRPLTIHTWLMFEGEEIDSDDPLIELYGKKPSECFADVTITGTVSLPIAHRGGEIEWRPFEIGYAERLEFPRGVSLITIDEYEDTAFQIYSYTPETDLENRQIFDFRSTTFGEIVPAGATGEFTVPARLVFRDYIHAPWALLTDYDIPLPNEGLGQPLDAMTALEGDVSYQLTRHSVDTFSAASLGEPDVTQVTGMEGMLSGSLRGDHGSALAIDATFTYDSRCGYDG